jgi:hypothetical protein
MSTIPEQLEIDLGDDILKSIESTTFNWNDTISSGSNGFSAQDLSITLPSTGAQGSITWSQDYNTSYTISGGNWHYDHSVNIDTNGIDVKQGDIKVKGKSLTEAIEKIEERLGILHPNPELEDRWDQLKDLRRQYQELEKDLLEKEKMWDILKKK